MNKVLDNPAISIRRQDYEPSIREQAQIQQMLNRGIAWSLDEAREELDTIFCMLKGIDEMGGNRKYQQAMNHFKQGLALVEDVITELEAS